MGIFKFVKRVFRFLGALLRYAFCGHFKKVGFDEYVSRLDTCLKCGQYDNRKYTCKVCGCYLDKKCKWGTESCEEGKW